MEENRFHTTPEQDIVTLFEWHKLGMAAGDQRRTDVLISWMQHDPEFQKQWNSDESRAAIASRVKTYYTDPPTHANAAFDILQYMALEHKLRQQQQRLGRLGVRAQMFFIRHASRAIRNAIHEHKI